ncbi:unnamed protein product, partial [Rotaria magnacalcarata]
TTVIPSILPSQCYDYTTITDASRNVNAVGSTNCDTIFLSGPRWVRFMGDSGTQLSTTPTDPNQCGTQVTGWYSGLMPAVTQTVTNGQVCFSWHSNSCTWSNTISVTNCGSFYVYELSMPPVCAARYCTNTPSILQITTTTTTTTTTPEIYSSQCYNYKTVDEPSRHVNASYIGKQCDKTNSILSTPGWVRFVGSGGTQLPTYALNSNQCSTDAPGWYSGTMPNTPGLTQNGTVCFSWEGNSCKWSNSIQVTNCESYYVYHLSPPATCSLRYCTDTPIVATTTTTTTTTTESNS